MNNFCRVLCCVLLGCFFSEADAQDFSNKGKEFFITFPAHVDGTQAVMGIYITSDVAASGQVQVGNSGATINFSITANTVRRIFLGNTPANDAPNTAVYQDQFDDIKPGSAIKVTSDQPVVVYAHIIRSARSASSLVLPTPTWGREYLVPSFGSLGASGANSGRPAITVVAKEANTVVEIVPRAASFNGTRPAGTPYTITLNNPGDVYQIQFAKDTDISGTIVRSIASGTAACKPIGVFSSTTWSAFECSNASGGDNLYQQLFPTRAFGRTFITAPFANRQRDIFRVFALDPTTVITKLENGATTTLTLNAAGFAQFETNQPTRVVGDKPIMLVQYMNSQTCDTRNIGNCINNASCPFPADPEMVILNPVEQTINNITLFSAHQNWVPAGQSNVNQCYLNIIIPTPAAASFRINGNLPSGNFQAIAGTGYSYLQENVSALSLANPVQQLRADSSFACIAYGYGHVESYGYNAGTNVKDLYQFLTLRDPNQSYDVPSACQLTPTRLFVTLPYPATRLEWKFNGLFPDVVQATPVADSTYTREGKTLYRFPLPGSYNFQNVSAGQKVTIIAFNPTSDGCTGEQQLDFDIVVYAKPTAAFNVNHTSCISDSARFTSTATTGAGTTINRWNWNFGDNTSKTGPTAAHLYKSFGTFKVWHLVTNTNGCVSDTAFRDVVVNPRPVAAFTLTGPFCQNRALNITNTSTSAVGNISRWYWIMGNGQVFDRNTGDPFSYAYPNTGTFTVKLVVTTAGGCVSDTVQQTITVGHVPVPGFTLPEVCLNDAFAEFSNTTTIGDNTFNQIAWRWTFGDPNANPGNPNTSTQTNGRHRYTAAADYTVKLVATSNIGCADSLSQTLTVNGDKPAASFDLVTTGNLCTNLPVQIRNKSTVNFGTITRLIIYWNNGVNNTDTTIDETPVFDEVYTKKYPEFASPATRQTEIRVQAFSGTVCVNDFTRTIQLHATPAPLVITIPSICLDANPRMINQGRDAGNNSGQGIYSGPGITNANGLFDPKIPGAGLHTIRYRYLTAAGCTDSVSATIRVWPQPTAGFDVSNITCINAPVTLTSTSVANANTLATWNWDYGNGVTEARTNGAPFTRTYTSAQNYTISLRVTTDSGCVSNEFSRTVTLHPTPAVNFDLPALVCLPEGRAAFTNRTTVGGTGGTPITYNWTFGPAGAGSTQENPVYNYSATGPFSVKLIATSARGCLDSATKVLSNIYAQAKAAWTPNPAEVCLGAQIQFNDQSVPGNTTIASWSWSLGDGSTSAQQNPSRVYANAGTYTVTMFYTTALGCASDTVTKTVTVHPYPVVNAGPDQFVLQGGFQTLRATVSGSSNYVYAWTPPTWLDNPAILQPVTSPEDDITYTLTVTGAGGCSASDDVFVKRLLKPEIPNAFSPNGDGINEVWVIRYLDTYPGATVRVFDRYGRIVFSSVGYTVPWDGRLNGNPLPSGVYYYIVDPKNNLKPMTGSVTILR